MIDKVNPLIHAISNIPDSITGIEDFIVDVVRTRNQNTGSACIYKCFIVFLTVIYEQAVPIKGKLIL